MNEKQREAYIEELLSWLDDDVKDLPPFGVQSTEIQLRIDELDAYRRELLSMTDGELV